MIAPIAGLASALVSAFLLRLTYQGAKRFGGAKPASKPSTLRR